MSYLYRETFNKDERLKKKTDIDALFQSKKHISVYPFRLIYLIKKEVAQKDKYPAKILISVPKKKIRNATHRNFIKRRIREIYRREKNDIYKILKAQKLEIYFAIIYLSDEILPYKTLHIEMQKVLKVLSNLLVDNESEK